MNTESIAQAAAAKLDADRDARISAVTALADSGRLLASARQALAEAEQKHSQLFRETIRIGWTAQDIKNFDIEAPTKNSGGRPRKLKTAASKPVDSTVSTGGPTTGSHGGDS